MTNARVAIDIVANDKSGKGISSAEKRMGTLPKHAGVAGRRIAEEGERSVGRSSRGMLRTLGSVEQASAKVFGGRSITSSLSGRLGALGEVASTTGGEMRAAASAGGLLEGAAASVGLAVGATVGILAAAAYGAFKLADGWAKGAAAIGRTAETIGVSTRALQEFTAAGERVGVDKGAASGTLGSLSQTLNDARYGRNSGALAILGRLGVGMKTKADGTADVEAMLPAIADGIARANSSGQRTAARGLGIGLDSLAMFRQGGKVLSGDMADAKAHAVVIDDPDIGMGTRIARKSVMNGQLMMDQPMNAVGREAARVSEAGYDAALNGSRSVSDGTASFGSVVRQTFAPAAEKIAAGGHAIERAAAGLTSAVIGAAQRVAVRHHQRASIALAQYGVESGYGRHMPSGSNNPFGIKARAGEPFVLARTREEDKTGRSYYIMAKFRKFASIEEAFESHARLLDNKRYARSRNAGSADEAADDLTGVYATDHKYGSKLKREIHGHGLDRYDGQPIPVKVEIEARGLPAGTRTKITAGRGPRPAISHALHP